MKYVVSTLLAALMLASSAYEANASLANAKRICHPLVAALPFIKGREFFLDGGPNDQGDLVLLWMFMNPQTKEAASGLCITTADGRRMKSFKRI